MACDYHNTTPCPCTIGDTYLDPEPIPLPTVWDFEGDEVRELADVAREQADADYDDYAWDLLER